MAPPLSVERLPAELVRHIVEYLDRDNLCQLSLISRWGYKTATPLIWRDLLLTDCSTRNEDTIDEHDDTPLIKKLLVLERKPELARLVHTITHRCHLPAPGLFRELPSTAFTGKTLSRNDRTIKLVFLATRHMTNVHTLRIIFGHPRLNDALIRCFFDKHRKSERPVSRLWLENCTVEQVWAQVIPHPLGLPAVLDFAGLKSIRIRRLSLLSRGSHCLDNQYRWVYARGRQNVVIVQDGAGGIAPLGLNRELDEFPRSVLETRFSVGEYETSLEDLIPLLQSWDDRIWTALAANFSMPPRLQGDVMGNNGDVAWPEAGGERLNDSTAALAHREFGVDESSHDQLHDQGFLDAPEILRCLFTQTAATLTSICFDWIVRKGRYRELYEDFFKLRFPALKALQFRNAISESTAQPRTIYLLDRSDSLLLGSSGEGCVDSDAALEFMEAHANIQCLAWPMDLFFNQHRRPAELELRIRTVVDNLGRTLTALRVDTQFRSRGESLSENEACHSVPARRKRRRFIEEFVAKMTKLESIKVEGGVPRDERREIIRALHACPLKKIVMIGMACSLGNTWGQMAQDLPDSVTGLLDDAPHSIREGEDKDATFEFGVKAPVDKDPNFRFEACYGWPPGPPFIHDIVTFHKDTVTELKFCGYIGCPALFTPAPITTPLLTGLKYCHNLKDLTISTWLNTKFEGEYQDEEIIEFWRSPRDPTSTSLVHVTDQEPEGWAKELQTKFAPKALADEITRLLGPFLSAEAKARQGGVHVRSGISIGDCGLFEVDVRIGVDDAGRDVCLEYEGPQNELEPERRRAKLESRRWF